MSPSDQPPPVVTLQMVFDTLTALQQSQDTTDVRIRALESKVVSGKGSGCPADTNWKSLLDEAFLARPDMDSVRHAFAWAILVLTNICVSSGNVQGKVW